VFRGGYALFYSPFNELITNQGGVPTFSSGTPYVGDDEQQRHTSHNARESISERDYTAGRCGQRHTHPNGVEHLVREPESRSALFPAMAVQRAAGAAQGGGFAGGLCRNA
jgi:hypothetical protein